MIPHLRRLAGAIACMASISHALPVAAQPAVAAGRYHNLGLASDGRVLWWGTEFGHAKRGPPVFPRQVEGLPPAVAVAAGWEHSSAITRDDGVVLGWGGASGGAIAYQPKQCARLCENPGPTPFFSGAIAIAAFADSTYALRADGSVWAWGSSWNGDPALPKDANPENKPDAFVARRVATLDGATTLGGGAIPPR